MKKLFSVLGVILVLCSLLNAQTEMFVRKHLLNPYAADVGGWGNIVTDIDIDGDGKMDLYAVNENVNDTPSEIVPRIYKFEWNGTKWDSVWSAEITGEAQNPWPALIAGDWDGDGKKEIIWGPINNFSAGSTNPARILVFESKGDGSDVMGIPILGTNNYRPNAKWTITQTASQEIRPFRWVLENVDDDPKPELVFCDRQSNYRFGIVSVSTIPDNGDGSEVWTLKASGLGNANVTGTVYDVNVINKTIYVINSVGRIVPVKWNGTAFALGTIQNLPTGSWKTSCVVDIDNNGAKEMVVAGGASMSSNSNQKVWLCKQVADTLVYTEIADFTDLISSSGRIYGGGFGDIDGNGKLDFVFGTRGSDPNAVIVRLKYLGGDITSPASYERQIIDKQIVAADGRFDIIALGNIDGQPGLEVLYSSGYGYPLPIVTLKRLFVETVSAVRVDANNDLKPDRLNETATVKAIVNGVNLTASANRFQYTIQDETGGIVITKGSEPSGGTVYNVGDELIATGKITQFRGTVQLELTSLSDVMKVSANNTLNCIPLTIPQYVAGGYRYQSRFVEINALYKDPSVIVPWPPANVDANIGVWDGINNLILRIDQDTDIDGQPEPLWPIRIKGVATQYTSSVTVYNDGYQITPMFYTDITQLGIGWNIQLLIINNGADSLNLSYGQNSLATDGIDVLLSEASLPPLPPSGVFDVRFELPITPAEYSLKDFRSDTLKSATWVVKIQAGDGGYPVTVSWNKNQLPEGTFFLKDAVTGTIVNVNMKNQDSCVLTNSAITTLKIEYSKSICKEMNISSGWNIISVPVLSADMRKVTLFPNATSSMYGYLNGYQTKDTAALGKGYWIRYGSNAVIEVCGSQSGVMTVPVNSGWNLIGIYDKDVPVSGITTTPANILSSSFYKYSNGYQVPTVLESGKGYWIRANQNGAINLNSTLIAKENEVSIISDKWAGLTLTDRTGKISRLYLSEEKENLSSYDLPPVPPEGIFDVRFGSDRMVENVSTRQEIIVNSAEYPVEIGLGSLEGLEGLGSLGGLVVKVERGNERTEKILKDGETILVGEGSRIFVETVEIPREFGLSQNYPNPFNPSTVISYQLPVDSKVTLKLYDVLGREVATLINEQKEAGSYNYDLHMTSYGLSSGVYLYEMRAGDFRNVKKMVLIK